MKKSYLLSGMIVFGIADGMHAMARPAAYQMIDALLISDFRFNWESVFAALDSMQGIIDVNDYTNWSGFPLLLDAVVSHKSLLAAKTLLEKYHANPNETVKTVGRPNSGMTALMFACRNNDLPMVKLLLLHGANPNQKSANGESSFDFLHKNSNPEILKELNKFKK